MRGKGSGSDREPGAGKGERADRPASGDEAGAGAGAGAGGRADGAPRGEHSLAHGQHGRDQLPESGDTSAEPPVTPGLLGRKPVHRGRIVDLSIDTVRFPDGSTGDLELIRHSGAAAVLPVLSDPDGPDPQILLVRQYRYAAGGYMLEVPAGRPEREGEPWEECAQRELQEEAGVVAGNLRYLTMIYTTPGFTDERIHLFLATDLKAAETKFDDDEFIEPVTMPLSDALARIRDGEITDAKTIVTLLYAAGFVLS
ncbi:MAG TPA: NUDIX hydrolase [Longimicrobiales bacterium]|nr:NUDIX hydrolase [Longimicrobiales bacterium]